MSSSIFKISSAALIVAAAMAINIAQAQEKPVPSKSVESFQSWTLECNNILVRKKAAKTDDAKKAQAAKKPDGNVNYRQICETLQSYTNKKTGNEVARLAFAVDGKKKDGIVAGLRVIVDASFAISPKIMIGDKELMVGKFNRCVGKYCFILFPDISDKSLAKLENAKEASIRYPIARGKVLSINISTKGLSDGLKAMKAKLK